MTVAPAPPAGVVVVGDATGHLYLADPQTGAVTTTTFVWGTLTTHAVAFGGVAFVAEGATSGATAVHAFDVSTGTDLWDPGTQVSGSIDATPVVAGSTLYVMPSTGYLVALDVSSGAFLWQLDVLGLQPGSSCQVGALVLSPTGNALYVASAAGLYAVDLAGRAVLWAAMTNSSFVQAAPLLLGEFLLAATGSSVVVVDTAATPVNGQLPAQTTLPASGPAGRPVSLGYGLVAYPDATGAWRAYHVTGWVPAASGTVPSIVGDEATVVEGWTVYAAAANGSVTAVRLVVDEENGTLTGVVEWQVDVAPGFDAAPVLTGPYLRIAGTDGFLYSVAVADGSSSRGSALPGTTGAFGPASYCPYAGGGTSGVGLLVDGPAYFLRLRDLFLAATAGTLTGGSTPATSPSFVDVCTNAGAAGVPTYVMMWSNSVAVELVTRARGVLAAAGVLKRWVLSGAYTRNRKTAEALAGHAGVQTFLEPYAWYGTVLPYGSQHEKIAIFSIAGTKIALVGGFNIDLPGYFDLPTHPMTSVNDGVPTFHSWHDTAVVVGGAAAAAVEAEFDRRWAKSGTSSTQPPGSTYAKVACWEISCSPSCLDYYESCSGQAPPTAYADPSPPASQVTTKVLLTNDETNVAVHQVRDAVVASLHGASSYAYFENFAFTDPVVLREIAARLLAAPGLVVIVVVPYPRNRDVPLEEAGLGGLGLAGFAAVTLATQQWESVTLADGSTLQRSALATAPTVVFDDRGTEYAALCYQLSGSAQQVTTSLMNVRDVTLAPGATPTFIVCSPARYVPDVSPDESPYQLPGCDPHFRAVYVHSKLALFDDSVAVVGSANFTPRSMLRDGELSVLVDDTATVTAMRETVFAHWNMTVASEWQSRMTAFESGTEAALGMLPLPLSALSSSWLSSWWGYLEALVDPSYVL